MRSDGSGDVPGAAAGDAGSRDAVSGVVVREYRDGDEHGILALFRQVFRVERSLAHWRWKFLGNPAGREIVVAVERDGRIVGQFASLPNRGAVDGRETSLSQLLDHMVDRGMHRRGVYAAMARAFHDRFVSRDPTGLWFGFNLEEIYRIEHRLYGMQLLHGVASLRFDTARAPSAARALRERLIRVERVARFGRDADRLWPAARDRYRVAIARDARYLDWRYAGCPDVDYVQLVARRRWTRQPLGLAVVRLGWPHEPIATLVDWVIPAADRAVWRALHGAAHAAAREAGFGIVRAWLPPTSPDRDALLALGYEPEASPFLVSAWDDGVAQRPLSALRDHWHYTMGDTDIY